uniref:CSON009427 protein n=1 Tax=Culicoides sonorensis TaxID=179676 RepID=A0A336LGL0_CULSO
MTFDEFGYLNMNEAPTIEDFILLCGTITAFLAFILWCCFPLNQKEAKSQQFSNCNTNRRLQNQKGSSSSVPSSYQHPKHYYSIKNDSYYYCST